ncbi:unnamed protein product [Amoebophrya sp. A120]|nr:unnamed protein product [Amoebophrya sp. A120]|eukprot:GSA120T00014012001.1
MMAASSSSFPALVRTTQATLQQPSLLYLNSIPGGSASRSVVPTAQRRQLCGVVLPLPPARRLHLQHPSQSSTSSSLSQSIANPGDAIGRAGRGYCRRGHAITTQKRSFPGPPIRQVFDPMRVMQNHQTTELGTFHRDLTDMDCTSNAGISPQQRLERYEMYKKTLPYRLKSFFWKKRRLAKQFADRFTRRADANASSLYSNTSSSYQPLHNYTEHQWRQMGRLRDHMPMNATSSRSGISMTDPGRSSSAEASGSAVPNNIPSLERLRTFGQERAKGRATRQWLPNHKLMMRLFHLNPDPRSEWVPQSNKTERRVLLIAVAWMLGWATIGCFVLLPFFFGEGNSQDLGEFKAILESEGVTEEEMIAAIEKMTANDSAFGGGVVASDGAVAEE